MLGDKGGSYVKRLNADHCYAVDLVHFNLKEGHRLYLGMHGSSTITLMDPRLFERLLDKYLGADRSQWNVRFIEKIAQIDAPLGRLKRLDPETFYTNNVSYFLSGPALACSDGMRLPSVAGWSGKRKAKEIFRSHSGLGLHLRRPDAHRRGENADMLGDGAHRRF